MKSLLPILLLASLALPAAAQEPSAARIVDTVRVLSSDFFRKGVRVSLRARRR